MIKKREKTSITQLSSDTRFLLFINIDRVREGIA